jgi:hypothetical protein
MTTTVALDPKWSEDSDALQVRDAALTVTSAGAQRPA